MDRELRELERRALEETGDKAAHERYQRARERAGLPRQFRLPKDPEGKIRTLFLDLDGPAPIFAHDAFLDALIRRLLRPGAVFFTNLRSMRMPQPVPDLPPRYAFCGPATLRID